jgi:hypothetical protein
MARWYELVALGAVLVMGASTAASASFFDLYTELPAPQYEEKKEEVVLYADGSMIRKMQFLDVTGRRVLTADGTDNDCDSFFDIFLEVSTDGGGNWDLMTGQGEARVRFNLWPSVTGVLPMEAEIMFMSLPIHRSIPTSGGEIMIRESPTRASGGGGSCTELGGGGGGGGGYMIDSFFDIFLEVSTDGGQNWGEGSEPIQMIGTPEPATLCLLGVGAVGLLARWRRK